MTRNKIDELRNTVDMDNRCNQAPFLVEAMRAAPETSFDEERTQGSLPSYQWYSQIEAACRQVRMALIKWRNYLEEVDYQRRTAPNEDRLRKEIDYLNTMHREICGVSDVIPLLTPSTWAFDTGVTGRNAKCVDQLQ